MLLSLHVENLALITNTTIEFSNGFNVITGETGAGKSLIMKALKLIIGAKASKDDIRFGEESALSEGLFIVDDSATKEKLTEYDVYADEEDYILISRRITAEGKSVCKINDRPVPLSKLKSVSALLMDIHGQNDTGIIDEKTQLSILDGFGKTDLFAYAESFKKYAEEKKKLEDALKNEENKELRLDMIKYQLSDLTKYSFKAGEEEKLSERSKLLKNSERINRGVCTVIEALREGNKNASDNVYDAISALRSLCGIVEEANELTERLESVKCEIDDIAETVSSFGENAEASEYELDRIESRLHAISALKRKYQRDYEGLLQLIEELKEEKELLSDSEGNIKRIKANCAGYKKLCEEQAKSITASRKNSAVLLEESVKKHLEGLNMPSFRFKINITPKELSADGGDNIEFLISANAGEEFKSLEKTASGGELSRFMLALKSAFSETDGVSSMVFDEIDTGISGQTSEKLGIKLKSLSKNGKQVICVTHSAQIASLASKHILITKSESDGRTTSTARTLSKDERIEEISRIMGGIQITDNVYQAAKEMLENGSASDFS